MHVHAYLYIMLRSNRILHVTTLAGKVSGPIQGSNSDVLALADLLHHLPVFSSLHVNTVTLPCAVENNFT